MDQKDHLLWERKSDAEKHSFASAIAESVVTEILDEMKEKEHRYRNNVTLQDASTVFRNVLFVQAAQSLAVKSRFLGLSLEEMNQVWESQVYEQLSDDEPLSTELKAAAISRWAENKECKFCGRGHITSTSRQYYCLNQNSLDGFRYWFWGKHCASCGCEFHADRDGHDRLACYRSTWEIPKNASVTFRFVFCFCVPNGVFLL